MRWKYRLIKIQTAPKYIIAWYSEQKSDWRRYEYPIRCWLSGNATIIAIAHIFTRIKDFPIEMDWFGITASTIEEKVRLGWKTDRIFAIVVASVSETISLLGFSSIFLCLSLSVWFVKISVTIVINGTQLSYYKRKAKLLQPAPRYHFVSLYLLRYCGGVARMAGPFAKSTYYPIQELLSRSLCGPQLEKLYRRNVGSPRECEKLWKR